MSDLVDILSKMSQDIDSLKEWRKSMQEAKQEDAGEVDTIKEFNQYITERRERENREARDIEELRKMMV